MEEILGKKVDEEHPLVNEWMSRLITMTEKVSMNFVKPHWIKRISHGFMKEIRDGIAEQVAERARSGMHWAIEGIKNKIDDPDGSKAEAKKAKDEAEIKAIILKAADEQDERGAKPNTAANDNHQGAPGGDSGGGSSPDGGGDSDATPQPKTGPKPKAKLTVKRKALKEQAELEEKIQRWNKQLQKLKKEDGPSDFDGMTPEKQLEYLKNQEGLEDITLDVIPYLGAAKAGAVAKGLFSVAKLKTEGNKYLANCKTQRDIRQTFSHLNKKNTQNIYEKTKGLEMRVNRDAKGLRFQKKFGKSDSDGVRIDNADANGNFPHQKVDHVIVNHNGRTLDKSGNPINAPKPAKTPEAHIPLQEWLKWKEWFRP